MCHYDCFWKFHCNIFIVGLNTKIGQLIFYGLTPKALQWPNFGDCCFGQVPVKRRCDMIFWEFYGK
jgi:hypothetical protein